MNAGFGCEHRSEIDEAPAVVVFFLAGGDLIPAIILGEVDQMRFTFIEFCEPRVRRIFPALFVGLMVPPIASWPTLPPALPSPAGTTDGR